MHVFISSAVEASASESSMQYLQYRVTVNSHLDLQLSATVLIISSDHLLLFTALPRCKYLSSLMIAITSTENHQSSQETSHFEAPGGPP